MPQYIKCWQDLASDRFCQDIIDRFERDNRIRPDPQPDYSQRSFLVISNLNDWHQECRQLNNIVKKSVARYFSQPKKYKSITPPTWSHDGFLIARYAPGDTCVLHVDGQCTQAPQNQLRIGTFILYLNTVADGGETHFPLQQQAIKPEAGKIAMFPPGYSHPHEALPAKQFRYILQTWITEPHFYVVDRSQYQGKYTKKQARYRR